MISRHFILIVLLCLPATGAELPATGVPEDFVDVQAVIPSIVLDIRYFTPHNFIGRRIAGYAAPKCYLTKPAAAALKKVQETLLEMGLSLKIYDGYRPQRAVNDFVRWAKDLSDTTMKREFYPEVDKRHLFRDGYIASRSGHSRGSTVDLTIVPLPLPPQATYTPGDTLCECYLPAERRFRDNGLDMGTGYDCFDARSHTAHPGINAQQRANRLLLKTVMEQHGFRNYPKEWWHFTLVNEPFPDTYFDFIIE